MQKVRPVLYKIKKSPRAQAKVVYTDKLKQNYADSSLVNNSMVEEEVEVNDIEYGCLEAAEEVEVNDIEPGCLEEAKKQLTSGLGVWKLKRKGRLFFDLNVHNASQDAMGLRIRKLELQLRISWTKSSALSFSRPSN